MAGPPPPPTPCRHHQPKPPTPEPTVNYQPRPDDPDQLLILTIEDGTNTVILHADEAVAVQQELTRVLRLFDLLEEEAGDSYGTGAS